MILNAEFMDYIRTQARMGDDVEDERFRHDKYWRALRMLAEMWRNAWPDCALKVTGFTPLEEGFRAVLYIDVEQSVFGNPGPLLDQFRATFEFADSDDLMIYFCQKAQAITDDFYDWQQQWVRQALQKS